MKKKSNPPSKDLNSQAETSKSINNSKASNSLSQGKEKDSCNLSYEESLSCLDSILEKIQKEDIPLQDLEASYRKAKLYLDHCEDLLSDIEAKIIKIGPDDIDVINQE